MHLKSKIFQVDREEYLHFWNEGANKIFFISWHIPKLFFRDADDFDCKTPSSNVEGVKTLVNVVLW